MFDLALTQSGDLVFIENKEKTVPFKISFAVNMSKTTKLSFKIEDSKPLMKSKNGIAILFNVKEKEENKKALTLHGTAAKIQAIKIRLASSLGDIKGRTEIGSKLELVKHQPLHLTSTSNMISKYVKEAIEDILPNADVRTNPIVRKNNGYSQNMQIFIYDQGFLIYKYDI